MTFVNEYIPDADAQKYDLLRVCAEHNLPSRQGHMHSRHWTIDRQKDAFLIKVWGHQESLFSGYAFYWKGGWVFFEMHLTGIDENQPDGSCWVGYLIRKFALPEPQEPCRSDLLLDLESALCTYCGAGVFSTCTSCVATIDFAEE